MHGEYRQRPSIRIPVIEVHVGVSRYDRVQKQLERDKRREALLDPDVEINREKLYEDKLRQRENYLRWLAEHQAQNALTGKRDDVLHRFTRWSLAPVMSPLTLKPCLALNPPPPPGMHSKGFSSPLQRLKQAPCRGMTGGGWKRR